MIKMANICCIELAKGLKDTHMKDIVVPFQNKGQSASLYF